MNYSIEASANISDEEIIANVKAGHTSYYEIMVHRYNACLYKIGRSYGFNHEDTQDMMQDSYISAYLNLNKFENRSTFRTWISRIMLNTCYHKKMNSAFKNEKPTDILEDKATPMFSKDSHTKNAINSELKRILETAIVEIPEKYRSVFTLRELNGMSVKETAEALEISESNVKMRLHRARQFLQDQLTKTYSSEDIYEFNLIYCDAMVKRVMDAIIAIGN